VVTGEAKPQDIAFYFVHWFADLAGAEPYPPEGCEKFVLKFPLKVLKQFVQSFSIVQTLGEAPETEVYENYLVWRWTNHDPPLGDVPTSSAIAKLRLVIMAQGDSLNLLKAFHELDGSDRLVLETELAIPGCVGQHYARETQPEDARGPAILVYYGPALLQRVGKQNPHVALKVLAEVFRQARVLWPFSQSAAGEFVIVRIDTLKEQDVHVLSQTDSDHIWVLGKTSDHDGAVRHVAISEMASIQWRTHKPLTFASTRRA